MSKKEKSIELLNKAVNDELLAVHQIYVFSFPVWWYGIRSGFQFIQTDRYPGDDARWTIGRTYFIPQGRSRNESGRRSEKADRGKRYVGTGGEDGNE